MRYVECILFEDLHEFKKFKQVRDLVRAEYGRIL